ncbi:MAG: hypothetical protein AMJ69_00275 [Gammaproteobacteria bacterium SG8_47]|nr:MAG: hypothetical protein AMJ69_00275 [Gammaproteobacteria bacterium SG8_47]
MPELPEVETTLRGIAPWVCGQRITSIVVRQRQLRYPVPRTLAATLDGTRIESVTRRAKYLLLHTQRGTLILHLGMSGSLRVLDAEVPVQKHDHIDIVLDNGKCLRLRDPRRFGALLWTSADPARHRLLRDLGPEPLSAAFSGEYLCEHARGRRVAVKTYIMDSRIVVGIGNIYANEALFLAGIRPQRAAGRVSLQRYQQLASAIKAVLNQAIAEGGTTLRDFTASDGRPGYFRIRLNVYDRAGEPCPNCGEPISQMRLGQRSTFYCKRCQR